MFGSLFPGFLFQKRQKRRISKPVFPCDPCPKTGFIGRRDTAFAHKIQREKEGTEPIFPAVDTVKIDIFPDFRRAFGIKPFQRETPDQGVPETAVLGRHRVEHGPVTVDADQEVVMFWDRFEFTGVIAHRKRMSWKRVKYAAKKRLDINNIGLETEKARMKEGK